ncbi:MAG: ATP-binding protein [Gammaproteobacteria bacterium]|nr:ATP-binding protein [Gammaproteobacteria bacterium]
MTSTSILGIIYGNAELAGHLETMDNEHIDAILKACDRGAALTQQLLAFSRKQALSPTAIDLKTLARGLEPFFQRTLGANIDIRLDAEEDLWQCLADPAQMETAVINLALNARDAMRNGGHLSINLRNRVLATGETEATAGDYVEMRFADTGGRRAAGKQFGKVFEPFFTTKAVGKGTGLGLSMIFGFVKQSGGLITIDSEEGQGTVVTLLIPRALSEHDHPDPDVVKITEGRNEHILLLEDDRELRRIVEVTLVRLGYRVTAVGDEAEVDAVIDDATDFDLMVSDIVLPGTASRPEIAARVKRRNPEHPPAVRLRLCEERARRRRRRLPAADETVQQRRLVHSDTPGTG